MRITLLIILLASLGFAKPKPSEVLHVVNENSTIDTDANGVYDFQDCLNWWYGLYHDTSNVLRISTSVDYNTSDQPQSIHWDKFSIDFDTCARWGEDVAVSLAGGNEYILDEICEWYEADSAKRWGGVKYPILWKGMPLKLRGNSKVGGLPGSWIDTTLYRPIPSALILFVRPGCDAAQSDLLTNWFAEPFTGSLWYRANTRGAIRPFVPGVDRIWGGLRSYHPFDTLGVWVLPCVMDADSVTYLRRALSKSTESPIINGKAKSRAWMVIDETESPLSDRAYSDSPRYKNNVARIFGTRVLCDADCVSSAARETTYLGWTGNPTLRSGDSCLVFFNSGDSHTPVPDSSENWYRQLTFPIASGALTWGSESYFGYSTSGYLRPGGTVTQAATADALKIGFTYVLASSHEPTNSGIPNDSTLSHVLNHRDIAFADFAYSVCYGSVWQYYPIGNPIGVLNATDKEKNWNSWRRW